MTSIVSTFFDTSDITMSWPLTCPCHDLWHAHVMTSDMPMSRPLTCPCHDLWHHHVMTPDITMSWPLTSPCHDPWHHHVMTLLRNDILKYTPKRPKRMDGAPARTVVKRKVFWPAEVSVRSELDADTSCRTLKNRQELSLLKFPIYCIDSPKGLIFITACKRSAACG
jgi:hypothetical protein